jgi:hypothetical protein
VEDYQQWRIQNGFGRIVPKFKKHGTSFSLSSEAVHGLQEIARNLGFFRREEPSINKLLEAIGLHMLIVSPLDTHEYSGFVDTDGLTEEMCYEQGKKDYNEKKAPSFYDDAVLGGRTRSAYFLNAYIRGYSSRFLDENLEKTPSFDLLLSESTSLQ